ncbi:DUF952 domain-containing protein [Streptomyces sp. BI20]|uniref:DUF952 domain-containing protein n=1 Tax=Streptomyces sp. BI20 TaxID=3403460 RepID=UPI003C737F86
MIFHLVPLADWSARPGVPYASPSLAAEGFTHCSADLAVALEVAAERYREVSGLVAVELDEALLGHEVRREPGTGGRYPHVYGPLERAAAVRLWDVVWTADGRAAATPRAAG